MLIQPFILSQLSVVHGFASSHLGAAPPTHTPAAQASLVVQALLSLHAIILLVYAHLPAEHASSVQGLLSLQSLTDAQLPPQPLIGLNTQLPLAGSQLSVVQLSLSVHDLTAPGTQ